MSPRRGHRAEAADAAVEGGMGGYLPPFHGAERPLPGEPLQGSAERQAGKRPSEARTALASARGGDDWPTARAPGDIASGRLRSTADASLPVGRVVRSSQHPPVGEEETTC